MLAWALIATWAATRPIRRPSDSSRQNSESLSVGPLVDERHYAKRTTICLNYRPNLYLSHYERAFSS